MTCVHWWRLETPSGPRVRGVCKRCGAKRVYDAAHGWQRAWPAAGRGGFGRKVEA